MALKIIVHTADTMTFSINKTFPRLAAGFVGSRVERSMLLGTWRSRSDIALPIIATTLSSLSMSERAVFVSNVLQPRHHTYSEWQREYFKDVVVFLVNSDLFCCLIRGFLAKLASKPRRPSCQTFPTPDLYFSFALYPT